MSGSSQITSTSLIASTAEILESSGYRRIDKSDLSFWHTSSTRLFEDANGVVGLVVYATWRDLVSEWREAQSQLVETMSQGIPKGEPKVWDGYLVLLTPSPVSSESDLDRIRYDVTRLRKLVATGDEIQSVSELQSLLSPLLPLGREHVTTSEANILAKVPDILATKEIEKRYTMRVINAFLEDEPLLESLDSERRSG